MGGVGATSKSLRGIEISAVVIVCFAGALASGCSESVIAQYTKLGNWSQPPDAPQVISGTPEADQAALDSSEESFTEADWKILERIAPRPIWERLSAARQKAAVEVVEEATSTEQEETPETQAEQTSIVEYVTISKLPDGKLRIFCPLRHYGGVSASSTRDGGTDRRKIILKPPDLKPVVELINKQLGGKASCTALPSDNTLVVTCDPSVKDAVLELLAEIDKPRKQVEITARIFEVSHQFDFQLGAHSVIQHIASDNTQGLASRFSTRAFLESLNKTNMGNFGFQGSALRLFQIFGSSGLTMDVTFQALAQTGYVREIASPRMTVVVGQTGYMLAGQELPISSARVSNNNVITEKTTYKPIGVQLYITPQTVGPDSVKLHVVTVVSALSGFSRRMALDETDSVQPVVNPILESREAETSVTVPDGHTLVIGGLRTVRHITRERKVPGLGDLKILEWLFKNHRSQRQLNDLYFFVTPRILK